MKENETDASGSLPDDTVPVTDREASAESVVDGDSTNEVLSPAEDSSNIDPTTSAPVVGSDHQTESIQSLTRLLVGGGLVGWEELQGHLQTWEEETSTSLPLQEDEGDIVYYTRDEVILRQPKSQASRSNQQVPAERPESSADVLRYALIGLLFESQSRLGQRSAKLLGDVSHMANRTADVFLSPMLNQIEGNQVMQPTRRRFEKLVQRGETITARWVRRGRTEEARSRVMVRTAVQGSFNTSMDQLSQAPALQQLVRKQSAGLTQDALDEVRGRVVTGDMLAESLARRVVRRGPRNAPPTPSIVDQPGE